MISRNSKISILKRLDVSSVIISNLMSLLSAKAYFCCCIELFKQISWNWNSPMRIQTKEKNFVIYLSKNRPNAPSRFLSSSQMYLKESFWKGVINVVCVGTNISIVFSRVRSSVAILGSKLMPKGNDATLVSYSLVLAFILKVYRILNPLYSSNLLIDKNSFFFHCQSFHNFLQNSRNTHKKTLRAKANQRVDLKTTWRNLVYFLKSNKNEMNLFTCCSKHTVDFPNHIACIVNNLL